MLPNKMKVTVVFEMAKDGGCSCYTVEDIPGIGLTGYGNSPYEAKADMLQAYEEIKEMQRLDGEEPIDLQLEYVYDGVYLF